MDFTSSEKVKIVYPDILDLPLNKCIKRLNKCGSYSFVTRVNKITVMWSNCYFYFVKIQKNGNIEEDRNDILWQQKE